VAEVDGSREHREGHDVFAGDWSAVPQHVLHEHVAGDEGEKHPDAYCAP
jgi:hypothetical protein